MRVALDATGAFSARRTGTGVYVRKLCEEFLKIGGSTELTFLALRSLVADTGPVKRVDLQLLRSPRFNTIWSQCRLPMHLAFNRYDLVHFVDQKLPWFVRGRSIVTIHDAAFLRFPESFVRGHRRRLEWFTRDAVRRADHIIAVSASTKKDLCEFYGLDPATITVVHHGVDLGRFGSRSPVVDRGCPYILAVGALQPRKNYGLLMRAFRRVCLEMPERIDLVIVGQRGWLWQQIEEQAAAHPFAERIHIEGYVSEGDLPAYYEGARLFVQPSLYEGFGMPVLEAMACGVPIIASSASSMPEVVGDAGPLVDPADEEAWGTMLVKMLKDGEARHEFAERGFVRVREFSWTKTAARTLDLYRALGSNSS